MTHRDPLLVIISIMETRKELADAQSEPTEAERGIPGTRKAGGLQGTVRLERGAEKTEPPAHYGVSHTGKLIPAMIWTTRMSFQVIGEQVSEVSHRLHGEMTAR